MAHKKGKNHRRTNKKQRRDTLQKVYYAVSIVFVIVRFVLFFWDRWHR